MLIHIALKKDEGRELSARVGDCIHRAVISALDPGDEGYFRIVTEQVPDVMIAPLHAQAGQTEVTATILIYPTEPISDRKKRLLFGRIGEGLEKEQLIAKRNLVVGVIEQPHRNWYYGGTALKLEQMMARGLV